MGSSPAQRFFGRRTRTGLPISPKLLKPKVQSDVKAKKQDKQARQKRHYDENAKELPKLKTNQVSNQARIAQTGVGQKDKYKIKWTSDLTK